MKEEIYQTSEFSILEYDVVMSEIKNNVKKAKDLKKAKLEKEKQELDKIDKLNQTLSLSDEIKSNSIFDTMSLENIEDQKKNLKDI